MLVVNSYNHLNAREYLIVNKPDQYDEIQRVIDSVDVSHMLKISCDSSRLGEIIYNQPKINEAFKQLFHASGWREKKIYYYVTGDERTTRDIVFITDQTRQKEIIESRGLDWFYTNNQVDFQKDQIAIEVQFGKYFSVAYDLHVKHTFFYSRNDIDVGVEIIPTNALQRHMDSGVSWFENEVTNVIREGRTNPPVPVLILGIEPEVVASPNAADYSDEELIDIIRDSAMDKFRQQYNKKLNRTRNVSPELAALNDRINRLIDFV